MSETTFTFPCRGDQLVGLLHGGADRADLGAIIVVGGPQYRIGSHRQYVLLARALADAGIPTLRFDYRGLGDSDGTFRGFEHIDEDIDAAIDAFQQRAPGLSRVVLWGLCDAASAILFYAAKDPRVAGVVLVNPWMRTETGLAETHLKHYYARHLGQGDFWRRLASGRVDVLRAGRAFAGNLRKAVAGRITRAQGRNAADGALPERMAEGFARYGGPVLMILSGNDLTAKEFEEMADATPAWHGLLAGAKVQVRRLEAADHTFSRAAWRDQVALWTIDWLRRR